jgi:hypothetical protein
MSHSPKLQVSKICFSAFLSCHFDFRIRFAIPIFRIRFAIRIFRIRIPEFFFNSRDFSYEYEMKQLLKLVDLFSKLDSELRSKKESC